MSQNTEKQGHIHAELMAQYAEDAKTSSKPWELWQIKVNFTDGHKWVTHKSDFYFDSRCAYRRKPKTHTVCGVEIPDLRFAPKEGKSYWLPAASSEKFVYGTTFGFDAVRDAHRLSHKLCYEYTDEGKQAAILHAKAWLGLIQ